MMPQKGNLVWPITFRADATVCLVAVGCQAGKVSTSDIRCWSMLGRQVRADMTRTPSGFFGLQMVERGLVSHSMEDLSGSASSRE